MNTRKKILFFFCFYKSLTGGPRTLLSILENLNRDLFEPVFLTQKESVLLDEVRKLNIKGICLEMGKNLAAEDEQLLKLSLINRLKPTLDVLLYNRRVKNVLDAEDIDLVWARGLKGVLLTGVAAKRCHLPLVWDVALEKPPNGIVRTLQKLGIRLANKVILEADSQKNKIFPSSLIKNFGQKITHIDSAIPEDRIRRILECKKSASDEFRILTIGSVCERKNQIQLLDALKVVVDQGNRVRLDVVGPFISSSYETLMKTRVRELGLESQVTFHGWRSDVENFYANSDLFVLVSKDEGVPHVIKEAMFAELPVIASRVGGIEDVVKHGQTGFLIDDFFTDTLVRNICRVISDKAIGKTLGANGKQFAIKTFNPKTECSSYEKIFCELLCPS